MLKSIKDFLFSKKPDIVIQAPSRINLINPLDAVEGDFWMPSLAINGINNPLSVFFYIKRIENKSRLKIFTMQKLDEKYFFRVKYQELLSMSKHGILSKLRGNNNLIYGSIYGLIKMNSYFEKIFLNSNIEIGLLTTIPYQSGLGGSAAIIIAVLYGLTQFYNLYNNFEIIKENEIPLNKDIIAEIATKIEDDYLKITSGYSDRYVICRGGLSFCSYYGKLCHKEISKEPLAIYDRIDKTYELENVPIIVCYSGVSHKSSDVHSKLRKLYLEKDPIILNSYKELGEIAWKSRFSLMSRDWKKLGEYFKKNTKIMNNIMENAGFEYGIGLVNNILIDIIEDHPEVYAAKLTGAGGGGSVFALVNPDKVDDALNYWRDEINKIINDKKAFTSKFPHYPLNITNSLKKTEFFRIKINKSGVKKL
ncbi:MAG: mevalonate kinase [Candidatus Thorarchaeota archaeon]